MIRSNIFLLIVSSLIILSGCATIQSKPITAEEIVTMAKVGTPSDTIIQKIRQSGTVYQLSAGELVKLHSQGVPTAVLDYMQNTYIEAVRDYEAHRSFFDRPSPYWHRWPYYYPW